MLGNMHSSRGLRENEGREGKALAIQG
jgi:hypothetical protein